jgi:hydrogenase maturation protease
MRIFSTRYSELLEPMSDNGRILVLAYGNPGRRDDGLGPALAAALEDLHLPGVTIDSDYQLTVEHAADVAEHDVVVFADAACTGPEPFSFARIAPQAAVGFGTHSVSPAAVLALARDLFGRTPAAYVLGIRGYEFNAFGEGLSPRAQDNLAAARDLLPSILRTCRGGASVPVATAVLATAPREEYA